MAERDLIDELLQAKVKATLFGGQHAPRLGRLVILEPLGSGGMGTVFCAYDPRLDRKVAVKLLRGSAASSDRVLREARALGKLNHPNVVAVHDATETDGVIAIVMELAPGESLRRFIAAKKTWREVLHVMREAAEGLVAAHRAGVVHRDIKPENIVIGPDRARLVDFGLASSSAAELAAPAAQGDEVPEGSLAGSGTPAYMAPEVLGGAPASEASDQFSFGVTFFEALYGARPHSGKTKTELERAAAKAARAETPRGSGVPAWLHRIVARALAAEPESRFSSMHALVRELHRDRQQRRLIVGSLAGLALMAAFFAVRHEPVARADVCGGGRARVTSVWPPGSIEKVRESLGDAPWAKKAADDFAGLTAAWERSHRRVCEATRVHGGQPESLLELRMRCLDRRFDSMSALADLLGGARDPEARDNASEAIASLPRPERCESLTDGGELALPDDPAVRARIEQGERELDRAWASYALGRHRDAFDISERVSTGWQDLSFPAFRARRLLLAAALAGGDPKGARRSLDAALQAAAEAHAAPIELEIWVRLLKLELFGGNLTKVVEWAPFARVAAKRAARDTAEVDGIEGEARREAGELGEARRLLSRAIEGGGSLRGDQRALLEMNLGSVELAAGNPTAAEAAFTRAQSLAEAALGREHPSLGLHLDKLAIAARDRGRMAEALSLHEQALELRRKVHGASERAVATTLFRRAESMIAAGKLSPAERDLAETRQSPLAKPLAEIDRARANAAAARGDRAKAAELYLQAAKIDPKLDLTAHLARVGAKVEHTALRPITSSENFSVDVARTQAERIRLLHERGEKQEALREAQELSSLWRARGDGASAALSNEVALAHQYIGRTEQATLSFRAALAALADEPSRERLRALTGIAECSGDAVAAKAALALLDAMPELDRSSRPRLQVIARR